MSGSPRTSSTRRSAARGGIGVRLEVEEAAPGARSRAPPPTPTAASRHLLPTGTALAAATYRLTFDIGRLLRGARHVGLLSPRRRSSSRVRDAAQHHHVPLLAQPVRVLHLSRELRWTSTGCRWLNLALRWVHIFASILWVGTTYYFTWLDGRFSALEKEGVKEGTPRQVWMVHSGGFYRVDKTKAFDPRLPAALVPLGGGDHLAVGLRPARAHLLHGRRDGGRERARAE